MPGAGSQRGMEMTSSAGNTGAWGRGGGSKPFYLGNQAPRGRRHSSCVLKEEQMFERRKGGARVFQVREPAQRSGLKATGAGAEKR